MLGAAVPVSPVRATGKPLWVVLCKAASTLATDSTVWKPTTPVAMIISAVRVWSLQIMTQYARRAVFIGQGVHHHLPLVQSMPPWCGLQNLPPFVCMTWQLESRLLS